MHRPTIPYCSDFDPEPFATGQQHHEIRLFLLGQTIPDFSIIRQQLGADLAHERKLSFLQCFLRWARHTCPPYNAFLGAPVISAASFAAVDGGRCALSKA